MWVKHCILTFSDRKYRISSLLDAAETVLVIFGFDGTLFDKVKDKNWWLELRRNRMNDVQAEADVR